MLFPIKLLTAEDLGMKVDTDEVAEIRHKLVLYLVWISYFKREKSPAQSNSIATIMSLFNFIISWGAWICVHV